MPQPQDFEKPHSSIQPSEQSLLSSPIVAKKRRQFWERLGVYNLTTLIFGLAIIVSALTILVFLWVGSIMAIKTGNAPRFWRTFLKHIPGKQVVTLSSVLIRFATSLHLGLFASMVAALILERVGVSMKDLAAISVIRAANSGPTNLIQSVLHSITVRSHLGYSFLIILAIINATALQFMSTILLFDFGLVRVVFSPEEFTIPYGLRDRNTDDPTQSAQVFQGNDYWNSALTSYPLFAEHTEARSQGDNWIDTGKVYRGFVPFSSTYERERIRKYRGPLTVFDARVVCAQPTLSNISVDSNSTQARPTIAGNLNLGNTHPSLSQYYWDDPSKSRFNCSLPTQSEQIPSNYAAHHWALAVCDLGTQVATFSEGLWMNQTDNFLHNTWAWIVLNVTGNTTQWENGLPGLKQPVKQMQAPDSSWTSVGHAHLRVDITLCVNDPVPFDYRLELREPENASDGNIKWNITSGMYDTKAVRELLGATSQEIPPEKRNTFRMEVPSTWSTALTSVTDLNRTLSYLWTAVVADGTEESETSPTYLLTNYARGDGIHRSHIAIFQDILHDTRNPALALQALFTNLMASAYYDFFPEFDISGTATIELPSLEDMPQQLTFFYVVLGLLGIHFFLIMAATFLFVTKTKASLLGNAWQPILQVAVEDRVHAIPHGHTLTDTEIWNIVNPESKSDSRIRIGWSHLDD